MAYVRDDLPPAAPSERVAAPHRCEAPACGRALSAAQTAKGARVCSPACRARAHRGRRKATLLARFDAVTRDRATALAALERVDAEVTALRDDVSRW